MSHETIRRAAPVASWQEPPGGILVWMIVGVELLTFAAGLLVFQIHARDLPAEFAAGRQVLHERVAWVNTLILLTGGLCMVRSVGALRGNQPTHSVGWLGGALGSGVAFLLIKGWEYAHLLRAGHGFGEDPFFTLYWMLTGFHALHVVIALLLLGAMGLGIRRGLYTASQHEDVEASAVFWHLCDVIWLLVYPTVYLLR